MRPRSCGGAAKVSSPAHGKEPGKIAFRGELLFIARGPREQVIDLGLLAAIAAAQAPALVVPFIRRGDAAEPSDAELVGDAIAGKRAAQHALYVRHCVTVRTRVSRLLGRSADVDDVIQDTFVEAFRDLGKLGDATRFCGWVCAIAVHQVHRRLRRRRLLRRLGLDREPARQGLNEVVDHAAGPEVHAQIRKLDVALSTLRPAQRIAWILRHVEGCTLEETATQSGVSLATVKRHVAAAESQLQVLLSSVGEINEDQ